VTMMEKRWTAMRAGLSFLQSHSTAELLDRVGRRVDGLGCCDVEDKRALPRSYGGGRPHDGEDFLVGLGLFYLTEAGRLFLDCTSGHYQMLWGYNHPDLCRAVVEAQEAGIVWDNHSNIPQWPVKELARRLLALANRSAGDDRIDKALMGVCTGSSACAAALKMQLCTYEARCDGQACPVFVVLNGNYHGTDMFTQRLRGMWRTYATNLEVVAVEPNDEHQLRDVFDRYGPRIAAFWAEPVMMNREAILVRREYLQAARACCDAVGAPMCIDEIQTGFWQPNVLMSSDLGFVPDMIVVGKGMTAGFHPLSALLFKSRYDVLEQYDALNTNGGAPLAGYVALRSLDMLEAQADRIAAVGDRVQAGFEKLVARHSDLLMEVRGYRHLAGLKFRRVADAMEFHRRAVEAGLWVRVHAYHEGHSTVLTKLGMLADECVVDCMVDRFDSLLAGMR